MVEMMMYALFRELILHTWKHIRPRVCLTANIENYTKSYKKDINDRIPKVKPQNPILLIVFDAAFAKVEHCRWVHFFLQFDELNACVWCLHEIQYLLELIFFNIMDYGRNWLFHRIENKAQCSNPIPPIHHLTKKRTCEIRANHSRQ